MGNIMSVYTSRSSRPDRWSMPVQPCDPNSRMMRYGRLQPMDKPSLLERILRQRK